MMLFIAYTASVDNPWRFVTQSASLRSWQKIVPYSNKSSPQIWHYMGEVMMFASQLLSYKAMSYEWWVSESILNCN